MQQGAATAQGEGGAAARMARGCGEVMETGRGKAATLGFGERPYLSLAEAAMLGPFTVNQLKHWMRSGTLVEGVHFTRPRNARPLIVREAFLAYLRGDDRALLVAHERKQRRAPARCNLSALREAV